MRTFIAIELPHEIKDSLARLQAQLKTAGADVKWVESKNIHLTLKFLGEVDEKKLLKLQQVLEEIVRSKTCFTIRLAALGAFPRMSSPRVIWVGIDKGEKETQEIAKDLEDALWKLGIPKEDRPFSSHITIGRTRSGLHAGDLAAQINNLSTSVSQEPQEYPVKTIMLFKSTLTPQGPLYEILKEAHLTTT